MPAEPKLGVNRGNAGKGRPKGSVNKITRDVREAVLQSFEIVGGAQYLAEQARANPTAYLSLVGKVLPLQVQGDLAGKMTLQIVTGVPRASD
jgi:hypothetical protein